MTKLKQVYRCDICGNVVEVLGSGSGQLVCCNQPMKLLDGSDEFNEKHTPLIEKTGKGYKISVGKIEHPMTEDHYIQWIELIVDGVSYIKYLKFGEKPVVEFCISEAKSLIARTYCNLHGLWKKSL